LAVGGAIGWLAGLLRGGFAARRGWAHAALGILGGLLGGFVLGPVMGGGNLLENRFDPMTIVVAALGATGIMLLAHLLRRHPTP
jgi:uncharacterized membrane protein YeaQ/YmgE (transglycosylase-associated protein family)